jgi:putative serine protease PepD
VLAASVVLGGAAGVGGAAVWTATHPAGSVDSAAAPSASPEPVVDDSPAPEGSVEAVAAEVLPSVVKIDVAGPGGEGSGSGIILTEDGTILTNNHVVEIADGGGAITVDFNDGSQAEARILGTDPLTDTAVIKAEGVSGLTPATIGRSGDLDVGQEVVAIGSPYGLDATVTSGIVSALHRPVNVGSDGRGNVTTYPAIQTDAAINPGNSGGALVDLAGRVVGINSSILSNSTQGRAGSIGLGFAIPIDQVVPLIDAMEQGETPEHARLGVSVGTAPGTDDGAVIGDIVPDSAAANAGLQDGDVITRVDDHRITDADSLIATVRSYRPGDEVTVTWLRDGEEMTADLTLESDAALDNG